ncbi:MAG TPA: ABC transporter ATP-binding protein [Allocoleopsis sp.]
MIEVENITKIYGLTPAIENITFNVQSGEIVGFLGPNGAGKTTTMRILAGYLPATTGTAKIAGYDVHQQSMEVRQKIGYLPENPPLYLNMSVSQYLHFVAQIKGVGRKSRANSVNYALEICNITDKRDTLIRKLSKGYRQRVGIAQAIVHNPPAIILDEPTVGLDPRQIIEVRNLIKNMAGNHTIILSTHILPEVSIICDRVIIINRGQIVAINTPDNLMTQMTGKTGYELEIEGTFTQVQQLLINLPQVSLIEEIPNQDLSANRTQLRVITQSEKELGKDMAAIIINAGLGLYEMRRYHLSLEEVFLQLTTTEKQLLLPPAKQEGEN